MISKKTIKSYIKTYENEETREVFVQNEKDANRLVAMVLAVCSVFLLIALVLDIVGVFQIRRETMIALTIQGVLELSVPIILYLIFNKKHTPWLKYVMVISMILFCMRLFSVLNHNVILVMTLPVIISSRYCSKGFAMMASLLTIAALAIASVSTVFYGIIDINIFPQLPEGTRLVISESLRATLIAFGADTGIMIRRTMIDSFLPRLLVFTVISMISVMIAKHGYLMVMDQNRIAKVSATAKAELETATRIQSSMVPNLFPAFPDRGEFDIFASMNTAKEVGGDFYDFFMIDRDHLALVMADVSGKGVPAALFMMATKILINDRALMGGTPAEILHFVNNRICRNNEAEMFVTVWLGILEISSGKLIAANAGHEYPAICRAGKGFELLKDKHGFVVGGMEGVGYRDYELTLNEGDALFLYTDGVTEAMNASGELFSADRMIDALNLSPDSAPEDILGNVKEQIDRYVSGAPQFDDITMMCLRYQKKTLKEGSA